MGKPEIIGLTVSVEFGFEGEYGKGTKSFANIQGRYPDPSTLSEAMVDGLDMYFAAWESLLASRYATGNGTAQEFKLSVETAKARLEKVRNYLIKDQVTASE